MITFFRINEPYGCLSNFSKHSIEEFGVTYKTAEHYYQSNKFLDDVNKKIVIEAPNTFVAAAIGRDRSKPLRSDWEQIKIFVMLKALYLKTMQNPEVKEVLLSTGNEEIGEESPRDSFWGLGPDGEGRNMLGKCWIAVRKMITS
jgi:N-glycosidase YbiA